MKTILLIRHAKSSWQTAAGSDFERPLNDRGRKDAPAMGKRLLQRNLPIDLLVSSSANRAKTTAMLFAAAMNKKTDEIIFVPSLYHATTEIFADVISELDDRFSCVAIFSHNPGITQFANELTSVRIDNMPTAGIFAVQAKTNSWKNFMPATKDFLFFDYPKASED